MSIKPSHSSSNTSFITDLAQIQNASPLKQSEERDEDHGYHSRTERSKYKRKKRQTSQDSFSPVSNLKIRSINHRRLSSDLCDNSSNELLNSNLKNMQSFSAARLGPGRYNYNLSTLSGPSFHFSSMTRFPIIEKSPSKLSLVSTNDSQRKLEIFNENKEMGKYLPTTRLKVLKEKAQIESAKILECKEKKNLLYMQRKIEKISKLQNKKRKFE